MRQSGSGNETSRVTRRRLLRLGGATLSAGIATTSAGCIDALPPLGSQVEFGRVDAPTADPPTYREWLPDPAELSGLDDGGFEVMYTLPGETSPDGVQTAESFPRGYLVARLDYFGIDYDDFDAVVRAGPVVVVETDLDRASVGRTLTDAGYRPAGSHRGYDLYARDDRPRATAVGDGVIVWTDRGNPTANVRTTIDAKRGAVPRYHEVSEDFATTVDSVGATPFSWIFEGELFDPEPGPGDGFAGLSQFFDGGDVYFVNYQLFPPDANPTEASIRETVREQSRALRSYAVDVTLDGRLATIEMWMGAEAYRKEVETDVAVDWPQVTWGVDHDPAAQTLRITHEAGDPIPTDEVSVESARGDRTAEQFEGNEVAPGDAVILDLAEYGSGKAFSVWFRPEGVDSAVTLFHYDPSRDE